MSQEHSRAHAIREIQLRRQIAESHSQIKALSMRVESARQVANRHSLSFSRVKHSLETAGQIRGTDPRGILDSVASLRTTLAHARKKVCGAEGALARVASEFEGVLLRGASLQRRHELILDEIDRRKSAALERAEESSLDDSLVASLGASFNEAESTLTLGQETASEGAAYHSEINAPREVATEPLAFSLREQAPTEWCLDTSPRQNKDSQFQKSKELEGASNRPPSADGIRLFESWRRLSESGAVFQFQSSRGGDVAIELVSLGQGVVRIVVTPSNTRDQSALRADRDLIVRSLTDQGLVVRDFTVQSAPKTKDGRKDQGDVYERSV